MKKKLLFIVALVAILCSCDTPQTLEDMNYAFFIFRFKNDENKELILTSVLGNEILDQVSGAAVINGVYNYPKRYRNEPYYFGSERFQENPSKYVFDICELATEEKLLALHDGYYTYFPYTRIIDYDQCVVRDGKWENLCNSNPLDLPILGNHSTLYKEMRLFEIRPLEIITGKNRKEMTIEDIEKAVNKLIDEGKLDKYSKTCNNMWASRE